MVGKRPKRTWAVAVALTLVVLVVLVVGVGAYVYSPDYYHMPDYDDDEGEEAPGYIEVVEAGARDNSSFRLMAKEVRGGSAGLDRLKLDLVFGPEQNRSLSDVTGYLVMSDILTDFHATVDGVWDPNASDQKQLRKLTICVDIWIGGTEDGTWDRGDILDIYLTDTGGNPCPIMRGFYLVLTDTDSGDFVARYYVKGGLDRMEDAFLPEEDDYWY